MSIEDTAKELFELEQSVQSQYLDAFGREVPNPVPMQPPVGYKRAPSLAEQMRAMIQQASHEAAMAGAETEDEANDFDVDEEFDPTSPWENEFEMDPAMEAMIALQSRPPAPRETAPAATPAPSAPAATASPPSTTPAGGK